ncbi:MAG: hypothetical protein IIW71_00100 [Treponema sp.]|nr:hypothetical protein [Treponema sp.]
MAVFDLTLSSFKFANTDGFTRDFGTKKTREQNGGSLTSRECNENAAKIFDTQRPFIVSENSSTGNIEYNATFVIGDNLSLTVGSATFTGCEIRLISGENSSVIIDGKTQILPDKSCNTLFWDGDGWNLSTNTSVPVNFVYTQFPLMPTPDKIFVGDWEDVSHLYAGLFLRVAGGEATAFENMQEVLTQSDTTITFADNHGITTQCLLIDTSTGERRAVTAVSGNTVTINSAFSTNLTTVLIGQNEGLPNITGIIKGDGLNDGITVSGAFYNTNTKNNKSDNSGYQSSAGIGFNAAKGETKTDSTLKTATEHKIYGASNHVTPCNATIKVWQRVS